MIVLIAGQICLFSFEGKVLLGGSTSLLFETMSMLLKLSVLTLEDDCM